MKNRLVIAFLIFLNIVIILKYMSISSTKNYQAETGLVIHSLINSININGKLLPEITVKSLRNESINLKNEIKKEKTILFLFSEIGCNLCIDSLIVTCNRIFETLDKKDQIIGIGYSNNLDYLLRFTRINKIKFPMFWDKEREFAKKMNIKSLPAILVLADNRRVVNSFFINPNIDEINHNFFDATLKFMVNNNY